MFTKSESVTGNICIWAIPRQSWDSKEAPPFSYRLYSSDTKPYTDGSVKVATIPVTLSVPAGINLLQAALDTLEDAKVEARKTYMDAVHRLDEQIKGLQMLTYQPEPPTHEGELILAENPDDDIPL
jgi:hypothetical protein